MTTISLYGGPLKRDMIKRAYGLCGQSVTEYELTPEEYDLGLTCANDIAATLGSGFGFNLPAYGNGDAGEESGIASGDVLGFTVMLAQELASNIGKSYSPNALQAGAKSSLIGRYQVTPAMELGRATPRGAGNRLRRWAGPFFITDVPSDETAQ